MKVIFLDVDGVLNTPKLIRRFGFDFIDPILVNLVARIVRETDSKVVLSSSWRTEEKDRRIVKEALGVCEIEIFDSTPVLKRVGGWSEDNWVRRHEEIRAWMDDKDVSRFAIIDDQDDAGIEGSFFQTEEEVGLTVRIAEEVIAHLNK